MQLHLWSLLKPGEVSTKGDTLYLSQSMPIVGQAYYDGLRLAICRYVLRDEQYPIILLLKEDSSAWS